MGFMYRVFIVLFFQGLHGLRDFMGYMIWAEQGLFSEGWK